MNLDLLNIVKYEKVREMIEKMLGCGKKESGYMEYVCPRCQKKKSVLEFIKRLVQHILPKGFQRVRYFGLHATCLREKIAETLCKALGAVSQLAFFFGEVVFSKLSWRAKLLAKFGFDPLKCDNCAEELLLWKIWSAIHGVIYYFPDDSPDWSEPKPSPKQPITVQLSFGF